MHTILVIDDDIMILELLSDYLEMKGFRPVTASSGSQGVEAFSRESPDLVLCDLTMPGLSGLDVLAKIKARAPLTPFVVFSGTTDLSLAVAALRQGAWDYLLKPLPGLELLLPLFERMEERATLLREKQEHQLRLEEQIRLRTNQLLRQLREKDILLAEVHHRVKNNLQIILVLLGLQQEHTDNVAVRAALDDSQERIHALALIQEEMHDPESATLVPAHSYCTNLLHHLLSAHGLTANVELKLAIEDIGLAPPQAFSCGLVINELMLGLAQIGKPSGSWSLSFGLRRTEKKSVELTMTESRGSWGSWVDSPGRSSLGWDLVEALASLGGGSVSWNPERPETLIVLLA